MGALVLVACGGAPAERGGQRAPVAAEPVAPMTGTSGTRPPVRELPGFDEMFAAQASQLCPDLSDAEEAEGQCELRRLAEARTDTHGAVLYGSYSHYGGEMFLAVTDGGPWVPHRVFTTPEEVNLREQRATLRFSGAGAIVAEIQWSEDDPANARSGESPPGVRHAWRLTCAERDGTMTCTELRIAQEVLPAD